MKRIMRPASLAAVILALSACAVPHFTLPKLAHAQAAQPSQNDAGPKPSKGLLSQLRLPNLKPVPVKPEARKAGQWPQAVSDVVADPDTRFGALPNGMRYAIRRQQVPPGQAALRLVIEAGSLMETDEQQGLAHFLEHMAFNGSKAVPEGEMVKILERLGLAFGADTNASTDFEQTTYKLDLPRTNDETLDTSLMLLRETASELTLDPGAVDRERGVVLSEERTRDSPPYRVYTSRLAFTLKGQRPPNRLPIGKVEILKAAPASQIAEFYHRYYRPERAVLVAVGDFDPDLIEAKIKSRFADWRAQGPGGADPDLGAVQARNPEAKLVVEPGAPLSLQIAWVRSPDLSPDTQALRRRDLIERLGFSVLNRRLQRLARGANPAFISAGAFSTSQFEAADTTLLLINADQSRWREALAAAEQDQRRAVQYGISQSELDREVEETRANLRADAAGAATQAPADLANTIAGSLDDDEVVTSPAQDLALFEAVAKDLKADQVSAAIRGAFKGGGPLVFMTTPKPVDGGEQALLNAFQSSQKMPVQPATDTAAVTWPYASFGQPGIVADTKEITDLNTVFVHFANGVSLTLKPTKFKDDEVLVRVNVGHGRSGLPRDRSSIAWASGAFIEGGLQKISAGDMEQVLASRVYGGRFSIADDAFVLSGGTTKNDLDIQLQVLAGYLTEPGWRPEAFARLKSSGKTIHDQYESTDSGVLSRDISSLLHPGDQRWVFPSRDEIASAKLEDFKTLVSPDLQSGAIEVVIVGDITVEKATDLVAQTFGALPRRAEPAPLPATQRQIRFPGGVETAVQLSHKGRADQAIGYLAWPTSDFYSDPQAARDTEVLADVLQLRLIAELREAQGATYSPQVGANQSRFWPGWGYLAASVEVPPAKLPAFFADVQTIAADLRAAPPTPDEMERAKKPHLDDLAKARQTNGYWLGELSGAQNEPRKLSALRAAISGIERVTAADVQHAAQRVLRNDAMWRLEVKPQAAVTASK